MPSDPTRSFLARILPGTFVIGTAALLLGSSAGHPSTPIHRALVAQSGPDSDSRVWVNTATGVYHCPRSRFYGATKTGEYLPESKAHAKGYRPAKGRGCSLKASLQSTLRVWVNTASGTYHCAGTRYYGKTRVGEFMTEGDAIRAGHHPANERTCTSG